MLWTVPRWTKSVKIRFIMWFSSGYDRHQLLTWLCFGRAQRTMARPPDTRPSVKLKRESLFFFYLIRWTNETARSKIAWITVDFHSVKVTQFVFKKTVQVKLILQVSPNVIRWCAPVVLIHASSSLIIFCFNSILWILTLSARYKKFPARFGNFTYGFLFAVTQCESRLLSYSVNFCY